jgi:hypothetical protein
MGKFSNNRVMQESDDEDDEGEEVGVWTFPFSGIMLPAELLNALYQDEYTHRSWYQTKKGVISPMPWVGMLPPPIPFAHKFENASIEIAYADSPNRNTTRDQFDGCKIGRIVLYPQQGGLTELRCSIQIKPGLGSENKRLQEYQNRRLSLSVESADIARTKASRQAELGLQGGAVGAASEKGATEADKFEEAARAQVEGFNRGRRTKNDDSDDAAAETH